LLKYQEKFYILYSAQSQKILLPTATHNVTRLILKSPQEIVSNFLFWHEILKLKKFAFYQKAAKTEKSLKTKQFCERNIHFRQPN
jgi:hypothetical protein